MNRWRVQCRAGSGVGLSGRALDSLSEGRGFKCQQEGRKNLFLKSEHPALTLISVPFNPRVSAVTSKRPRSS